MNNMNYKENNNNKEFLERYAVNLNQRARGAVGRRTILSWSENPVSVRRLSRRE